MEQVRKRKPGRPKKAVADSGSDADEGRPAGPSRLDAGSLRGKQVEKPPSKKRGRPKKTAEALEESDAEPAELRAGGGSTTGKKKRGHPKKGVAEEEEDAEVGARGKDIPQEELNAKLKAAILEDKTLHLRVLRYEVSDVCSSCSRLRQVNQSNLSASTL